MKLFARRAGRLLLVGLLMTGCASPPCARYVYQDGEFGVVAIPVNTYFDRWDCRAAAEDLMAHHFPEGYEIVRAEEVIEGEKVVDVGHKAEVLAEPNLTALHQVIKLGKLDRTTTFEEKDQLKVRECRIVYKKKSDHALPGVSGQFASVASLTPKLYIDPNELLRQQMTADLIARANGTATKKAGDPDVQKASTLSTKPVTKPAGLTK
jgi:hypothetical protein